MCYMWGIYIVSYDAYVLYYSEAAKIHELIAEYIEKKHSDDLSPYFAK